MKVTVDSGFLIDLRETAIANDTLEEWSELAVQCIRAAEKIIADQKAELERLNRAAS